MTDYLSPLHSLQEGHWFKLICGASFQHLPTIRTLALVYALAGADCIDIAADPAIVSTVREALAIAHHLAPDAQQRGFQPSSPWLMVSLNDGEDPHFRKAEFDPEKCPADCSRPCESICPAHAIVFGETSGVIDALCYGCGRCLPICPIDQIAVRSYVYAPEVVSPMLLQAGIDAIEIHTQVGRLEDFKRLWSAIAPYAHQLKLIAISCPDGENLIEYLQALYELMQPLPCALIWQTDGRPMSGDIGDGATRACLKLGQKVLAANLPGFVQLAGGTNKSTVPKLQALNLLNTKKSAQSTPEDSTIVLEKENKTVSGIAYGSYARSLLLPVLTQLEALENCTIPATSSANVAIETMPDLLWSAVELAHTLVHPLKSSARDPTPCLRDQVT